ncbi:MAG: pyruvate formate lyase family protein [Faecalibacterium sp.]
MKEYTYQSRIAALREKKITDTLAKKAQQGYMDSDDYGTVPKPEGYSFTPVWTDVLADGERYFYGLAGNAATFQAFLENHPLYIDPREIMCGRWADMLQPYRRKPMWQLYPHDHLKSAQAKYGITPGIASDAHCACDYNIGLSLGFGGLLQKLHHYQNINADKAEFYQAEETVLLAMMAFIQRHIDALPAMIAAEQSPQIKANLQEMLDTNLAIKEQPPTTFLQACQWMAWFNTLSRMYDRDGAGCNLDVILYPYYLADIKCGILTPEKATFILANLLLIDTHYYQLSGADENDNDLTNPLSFLILDAAHMLNTSANLTIRMHDTMDPAFLRKGVEYLFTDRNAWPRFSGDKGILNYCKNPGITKDVARKRIAVGCNWMAVPGKEYPLNDCIKINMAKVFYVALEEMITDANVSPSLENLMERFAVHTQRAVDITAQGILHHLRHQKDVTPELVMNLMMENTLEEGCDFSECALIKTMGVDGVGLGTVADSLAAIEQRVVQEKRLTWKALWQALQDNFTGTKGEYIRLMLKASQRYCQGASLGDKWALEISKMYAKAVHEKEMPGGVQLVPGWFSWSDTILFGKQVGATPDGRFAHTPVTHGANPNPGFRADGAATAMATGIADIQTNYGNTCPFQIELDPKLSVEQGGIERVEQILKTHVEMGGTLININILDKEKLMQAHENPLLYPDLVVRVTGFTAYFATLSPEFRQLVVDRFIETI